MREPAFVDEETLPNGIYVRRKVTWHECELEVWPKSKPWLATINISPWHYSSRGEATKEQAVNGLLEYMQEQLKQFHEQLLWNQNRIKNLTEFLEKQHG